VRKEFLFLEEVIKERGRHSPVYYFDNPGNWGDALIRYGETKFLRSIGVHFHEVTRRKTDWLLPLARRGILIYGGSGAWCRVGDRAIHRIRKVRHLFKHIIVLPSTYEVFERFPRTTYFARDRFESLSAVPDAHFCHDMAFCIGAVECQNGEGTGHFFRLDVERSGRFEVPPNNFDLSGAGDNNSSVAEFFDELSRYAVIHTDRLHVAIASCLLGKEVHLYPNSYFKNHAVFRSSLQSYFKNVHFHSAAPAFTPTSSRVELAQAH
jgi:hypothetical protein